MIIQGVKGEFADKTFETTEDTFVLGRDVSSCNIIFPDKVKGISRVHCKINFSGGRYYITDLGSANGTSVNQRRLEKQQTVELHSGDCIRLANSDFIISF